MLTEQGFNYLGAMLLVIMALLNSKGMFSGYLHDTSLHNCIRCWCLGDTF